MDRFVAGEIDTVRVAYMRFESNARQIPEIQQCFRWRHADGRGRGGEAPAGGATYEFTPDEESLLNDLLPQAVRTSLFQAFNDAVVSEQIMRMIAMKAATDNAAGLGRSLKRDYNRARQARITTELTEIVSGAAALALRRPVRTRTTRLLEAPAPSQPFVKCGDPLLDARGAGGMSSVASPAG